MVSVEPEIVPVQTATVRALSVTSQMVQEATGSDPHLQKGYGGARGVMVIVVENGHGDTSSNPGRDWLNFT